IWHGRSGRGRLTDRRLAEADRAIAPWRRDIVENLRALRRRMKSEPDTEKFYQALKTAELEAERIVQRTLATLASPVQVADPGVRLADADANLALYLGPGGDDASAVLRRATREAAETG
ncbi:MAG: DUF2390 domain-containing protein, partial [Stellaceae bacterium]